MVIGDDSFKGMGIDFADINNDGIFDMYVSNIASPFRLQESHFLWVSTGQDGSHEKWSSALGRPRRRPRCRAQRLGVGHAL